MIYVMCDKTKCIHNKVYKGYLECAKEYPERIKVIDASGSRDETHAKIINALKQAGIIW